MLDHIFNYFLLISIASLVIFGVFSYFQNNRIITKYTQPDSIELKKISGKIVVESGFLRKSFRFCTFHILLNQNSVFLFPADFYFIPSRFINLTFNSDKRNTKSPTVLREFSFSNNSVVLVSYPNFLANRKRTIYLQNLTADQINLFQQALKNRMPSVLK
ncbi:hypothetical protein [Chryseobacterium vrystaatense]|uniref:GRAM domain-containing protein n=1 Tax=Chryseobacterium vrystaatense TaxID=307480 RepID=A0A1M5A4I8_9FLAO|nr:hypothetical protein [Chryseobacterium vrystaatense]SHF25230.1 hypothetical protein SAMN02787073_1799 [Chryseobacterium vrystaatense]